VKTLYKIYALLRSCHHLHRRQRPVTQAMRQIDDTYSILLERSDLDEGGGRVQSFVAKLRAPGLGGLSLRDRRRR